MGKIFTLLLLFSYILFAEVINMEATPEFVNNTKMKIIDIRTPQEWRETGIVRGSYTLTFFDERGHYNIESFLNELNKIVKKDEKFALICRTGSRTGVVSNFLGNKLNYRVVNLRGGILNFIKNGYKTQKYK